ncbi:MucBP domain-containing protein [Levilactobacillus yonginensis]|uniref:MucBP domain-containing protein n=1 Tax=Levilactobacillus yonginensis TaxID=1054041 RepID=UPI00345D9E80
MDRFNRVLMNKNNHYLLFAGLILVSLNIGLTTGSTSKASAETLSPQVAMTPGSSPSSAPSQINETVNTGNVGSTADEKSDSGSLPAGTSDASRDSNHATTDKRANELTFNEDVSTSRSSIKSRTRTTNADLDAAPSVLNNSENTTASNFGDEPTTSAHQHQIAVHYYKKDTTEQLAPDSAITVIDGQAYTAPSRSFTGHNLSSQTNTTGSYSGAADTAFYYAVQKGTVHVSYKTSIGGELFKKTITGNVGDKFTIDALDFNDGDPKDFMLKGAHQVTGTYTSAPQTVTFTYQIPSVHSSTQHGMTVFTTTYADGNLKKIEIFDGNFDITCGKDSKGHAIVAIHSLVTPLANNHAQLSNKAIANVGKRFGYFATKATSYIFEKSTSSTSVKVMKINNQFGALTVATIDLTSKNTSADAVAQTLGISGQTTFTAFWHKYIAGKAPATSSIREKDARHPVLNSQSTAPDNNLPGRTKLPQTSEAQANFSIYGYFLLLLLSIVGLLKKEGEIRKF